LFAEIDSQKRAILPKMNSHVEKRQVTNLTLSPVPISMMQANIS
jgi:hypothetical protein